MQLIQYIKTNTNKKTINVENGHYEYIRVLYGNVPATFHDITPDVKAITDYPYKKLL